MIYCIWYPGGGFGHFINAVLSLYGKNFKRPAVKNYKFSSTGDSHQLPLVLPKYVHDPDVYQYSVDPKFNYSVLIDNGNENEGDRFRNFFPDSEVIKICYSDFSWPVIAKTMIAKTSNVKFEEVVKIDHRWLTNDLWATREKYFLYLRDHPYRYMWNSGSNYVLNMEDLFEYSHLQSKLLSFGIETKDFKNLWEQWFLANKQYIDPVIVSNRVLEQVKNEVDQDLNITDLWTQSNVYFLIWNYYKFEVPHNSLSNFFSSTREIINLLKENNCYGKSNKQH